MTESLRPTDRPNSLIAITLKNKGNLRQLLTDSGNKDTLLGKIRQDMDSFDPQEKLSFFRSTLNVLSDGKSWNQDQRDVALELLKLLDLQKIEGKEIKEYYLISVDALSLDADPYGEIDALLTAGKIVAPFIPYSAATNGKIDRAWAIVILRCPEDDRQKILDDVAQIKELIPSQDSVFDQQVQTLAQNHQPDNEIAQALKADPDEVARAIDRLKKRGVRIPRRYGAKYKKDFPELLERVKTLREQNMPNLQIRSTLDIPDSALSLCIKILIERGEILKRR